MTELDLECLCADFGYVLNKKMSATGQGYIWELHDKSGEREDMWISALTFFALSNEQFVAEWLNPEWVQVGAL